jgi:DNA topoisomerase-1
MARTGGWRRKGRKGNFHYVDARGKKITDPEKVERIESLVIPPAWRDVWISPRPRAKLQATGVDRAGRRQYLYHPEFRAQQERAKFDNLVRFAEQLPELRKATSKHIEGEPLSAEWTCAVAIRLINMGWFRVGTERYARTTRTFGITTLRKSHVSIRGSRIAFKYRGKHRVLVRTAVADAELADALKTLRDLPGAGRLFRYEHEGSYCDLTGARLMNTFVNTWARNSPPRISEPGAEPFSLRSRSRRRAFRRRKRRESEGSRRCRGLSVTSSGTRRQLRARRTSAPPSSSSISTVARSTISGRDIYAS